MKRGLKWSDGEDDETSSSDESSAPETNSGDTSKLKASLQVDSSKKKKKGIDFEALSRHGYRGGLSVLKVPPPKEAEKQDWSWCSGKEQKANEAEEESFRERQKTRDALADGEQLLHEILAKLVGGRTTLKKRRGCFEAMGFILVLILDSHGGF